MPMRFIAEVIRRQNYFNQLLTSRHFMQQQRRRQQQINLNKRKRINLQFKFIELSFFSSSINFTMCKSHTRQTAKIIAANVSLYLLRNGSGELFFTTIEQISQVIIERNEMKRRIEHENIDCMRMAFIHSIIDSSVCIRMCIYYLLKRSKRKNDAIKQMEAKCAQFKMRIQGHASVVHLDFLS